MGVGHLGNFVVTSILIIVELLYFLVLGFMWCTLVILGS